MTPRDKLASVPDPDTFLKPGITLAQLQAEATRLTDHDAASNSVVEMILADLLGDSALAATQAAASWRLRAGRRDRLR